MKPPSGSRRGRSSIGLVLAGGGAQGAVYEIGALRALEEAIDGLRLDKLDVYVGVSAGSFVAALLVNGLTPAQLGRAILRRDDGVHPFDPATFFRPAAMEWLRGGLRAPGALIDGLADVLSGRAEHGIFATAARLSRSLPVALFANEPIRTYLEKVFETDGRTNDFRKLDQGLFVIASDLEAGKAVRFGAPGFDDIPISLAVQASTALPGLYPPVSIRGRHYVDGVLHKTLHASVALDAGAELLFCVNPLVPLDFDSAVASGRVRPGRLVDRGVTAVLSQTFRTLIRSRLHTGMAGYVERYPDADIVLLEPRSDDADIFFGNPFSFASRRRVAQHAYRTTRAFLRSEADRLAPLLARHGLRLNPRVLADDARTYFQAIDFEGRHAHPAAALGVALDGLEAALRASGRLAPSAGPRSPRAPRRPPRAAAAKGAPRASSGRTPASRAARRA